MIAEIALAMGRPVDRVTVKGFKSLHDVSVSLGPLNVLIGPNGVGKSNFIGLFKLLNEITERNLQLYVGRSGGAEAMMFLGRKQTAQIEIQFEFDPNLYRAELQPTADDSLIFSNEYVAYHNKAAYADPRWIEIGRGNAESNLSTSSNNISYYVRNAATSWRVYHFHDTSDNARVKSLGDISDNVSLRGDAANLAAFLFLLRERARASYDQIVRTIRQAAPFFRDFVLRPYPLNPEKIRLEWMQVGTDEYFGPASLSDGTLRFICLSTLLLQPDLPSTILIDEPELGLHPAAITLLTAMLRSAAKRTQIIVSTQSVPLVNQLDYEDLIVVDRRGEESVLRRLQLEEIEQWLEDYGLGEIWEKNIIGGRP